MKLPFHLILDYAHTKIEVVNQAFTEFFAKTNLPDNTQEKEAFPLFVEWLIFDFRQQSGVSFLNEYILKNPDKIEEKILNQLKQVAETFIYGGFEIVYVDRKLSLINLEHLFSGKTYAVYDKMGASSVAEKGTIINRIAKVDGGWYMVGSNPIYLPNTFTKRFKKILKGQSVYPSPQDTWLFFTNRTKYTEPENLSKDDVVKKRQSLKKQYELLVKKHNFKLSFAKLLSLIYEENGSPPLDIWAKITKQGISNEVFVMNTALFQDIWNYFPHKILNNNSPVEIYQKNRNR